VKKLLKRDQSTNTDEFDLQHAHLSIMSKQELWELWNLAMEEEKKAHDLADSYCQRLGIAEIEVEDCKKTNLYLEDAIDELQLIAEGKTESHDKYPQELQDILHQKEAVISGKNIMIHFSFMLPLVETAGIEMRTPATCAIPPPEHCMDASFVALNLR